MMWCPKGCKTQGAAAFLPLIAPSATSTTTSCPLAGAQREKYRVVAGAAEYTHVGRLLCHSDELYCCHKWLFGGGRHRLGVKTLINTLTFSPTLFVLFFSLAFLITTSSAVCSNRTSTAVSAMMSGIFSWKSILHHHQKFSMVYGIIHGLINNFYNIPMFYI